MKGVIIGFLSAAAYMPLGASAERVDVSGKNWSTVTAQVVDADNLIVSDEKDGWFDQGLEMHQLGGWDTPYEVQVRLKVVSSSGTFQVRMDSPLTIQHQSNPALAFQPPTVKLGTENSEPRVLAVGQGAEFKNPASSVAGVDSVGFYSLTVSAYPPTGGFKNTVGAYSGVLALTFEPVVKAP